MKKSNIKMQLSAMNGALVEYAEKKSKKEGLNQKETSSIKQRVLNAESYINMDVYRTNKMYKTLVGRAMTINGEIAQFKVDIEEEE